MSDTFNSDEDDMPALPTRSEMERAYISSDASYDGLFFVAVKTTGVFCLPSCGARKPLPKNVEFFATPREALFAGYRPCKRCRPMEAVGESPDWLTRLMHKIDADPERRLHDSDIRSLGIDPARARRHFQKNYGMTFQAFCRARRLGRALEKIRNGSRLDDVVLDHGFDSHSGFRDAFVRTFGTPPGSARSKDCIYLAWIESPLGPLIAGATDESLVLLEFTDRRMLEAQFETLRRHFGKPLVPGDNPILRRVRKELKDYFKGKLKKFSVPVEFPGSEFQRRVWKELQRLPYGTTVSYHQLARRINAPDAQRAVGHSNGLNRIAIVIPCHRVVNADGKLGGYGGGVWRKQALLELERGERTYDMKASQEVQTGDSDRQLKSTLRLHRVALSAG